jgi:hypothetical protein
MDCHSKFIPKEPTYWIREKGMHHDWLSWRIEVNRSKQKIRISWILIDWDELNHMIQDKATRMRSLASRARYVPSFHRIPE